MVEVWIILVLVFCDSVHFVSGTIVNMALRKTSTQSTTIKGFGPEKAVDGNTSASYQFGIINTLGSQTTAWWKVDMETIVEHPEVEVYFRTDYTWRRNGLQLYTSTEPFSPYPGGQSCYNVTGSDNGTDINSTISVICSGRWRYFMVYTDVNNDGNGAVLDFGEVRVLVCSNGTYGLNCEKFCSSRQCAVTPPSSCDRYTGACPGGCKAGWIRTDCVDECTNGTYGRDCVNSCNDRQCRAPSSSCDLETGQCPNGCLDGWRGVDCTNPCPSGSYGPDCNSICGNCTGDVICDHVTGNCPGDCKPGWRGSQCKQDCDREHYGSICARTCADRHCITGSSCSPSTGLCERGCQTEWAGIDCMEVSAVQTPPAVDQAPTVAGAVAAVIVVILIVVVAVVIWRRKKRRSGNETKSDHVYYNTATPEVNEPGFEVRQAPPVGHCDSIDAMSDQGEGVCVPRPVSDITVRDEYEPVAGKTYDKLTSTSSDNDGDYTGLESRNLYENVR